MTAFLTSRHQMNYQPIYLKKNEDRRIIAGHLWIYSNEIDTKRTLIKHLTPGELVTFFSAKEQCLGVGYINPNTLIAGRILSKKQTAIDDAFFEEKFKKALALRESYFPNPFYRLVFGESDGLPGLVIDRFEQIFSVQMNTAGMEQLKDNIIAALTNLFNPSSIILKNDSNMRQVEGLENYVGVVGMENTTTIIKENDCTFQIPLIKAQKTGWFYDHRNTRQKLAKYVKDKKVLDAFSYLGAFGIHAAYYGAKEVLCMDISADAMTQLKENAKLNNLEHKINYEMTDVFTGLKKLLQTGQKFDVIILDPPALIKKRKDLKEGIIAYLRLNELAMGLLNDEGILVSCSCSLHMDQALLLDVIRRASLKTNKYTQVLESSFQDIDHPIHPAISETAYLKAYFCRVTNI